MRSLKEILDEVEYVGVLNPEYELTRRTALRDKAFKAGVKGSSVGIYTNIYSSRRSLYRFLGVENDCKAYAKLMESMANPAKPIERSFEDYYTRVDIGLDRIPFIKYYREDGGYFLTGSIIHACRGEVCNASFHRVMRLSSTEASVRIVPRHLYKMYREALEEGLEGLPVAIVLGAHPLVELASATSPPYGVYELWVANTLMDGGLRIAYTPLHNIPVPVEAVAVIEGVLTREQAPEGPFVDILRIPDKQRLQPVFKLEAVYLNTVFEEHFIHAIVPGFMEHHLLMGFPREAQVWESVRRVVPTVKAVRLTVGGGSWLHATVSIRKRSDGDGKNAILAAFTGHPSLKHVVVVDDDIDIDNPYEVEFAIATRFQASRDLVVIPGARGSTLDPSGSDGILDKMGLDATKPLDKPWEPFRRARVP